MRLLYLKGSISLNSEAGLHGRSLLRHLKTDSIFTKTELRHSVVSSIPADIPGEIRDDFMSIDDFRTFAPDAIYMESGFFDSDVEPASPRIPLGELKRLVQEGTVLWVSDVDDNRTMWLPQRYLALSGFLGTSRQTAEGFGQLYGEDPVCNTGRSRSVLAYPERMTISGWLQPAYAGIERIQAVNPIVVHASQAILATGNEDTSRSLGADRIVDDPHPFAFATVRSHVHGYVVLCGAGVSHDVTIDSTPDNARWISNTYALLMDRASENRALHAKDAVLGRGEESIPCLESLLKKIADGHEGQRLEAKETFAWDVRTKQQNSDLRDAVLKTVAAFANASGGTLLIGVQDRTGVVTGLQSDYRLLGKRQDWDTFQNQLSGHLRNRLGVHVARSITVHNERHGDRDVAVVVVSPSRQIVYLDNEQVYVRVHGSNVQLKGFELERFIRDR